MRSWNLTTSLEMAKTNMQFLGASSNTTLRSKATGPTLPRRNSRTHRSSPEIKTLIGQTSRANAICLTILRCLLPGYALIGSVQFRDPGAKVASARLDGQDESIASVMLWGNCLLIDVLSRGGGTAPTRRRGRSRSNRFTTLSVCRAIRAGLLTALIATAWVGERVDGWAAQTSPAEPAKAPPRKQSAGDGKDVTKSESRYTAGLVTGVPQSTEFAIAQEIATTLGTGQETGLHGEMALRVLPTVGNGGVR